MLLLHKFIYLSFLFVSFLSSLDNVYSLTFPSSCFTGSSDGGGPILPWLAFVDDRDFPDFCLTNFSFFPEADVTGEIMVGI